MPPKTSLRNPQNHHKTPWTLFRSVILSYSPPFFYITILRNEKYHTFLLLCKFTVIPVMATVHVATRLPPRKKNHNLYDMLAVQPKSVRPDTRLSLLKFYLIKQKIQLSCCQCRHSALLCWHHWVWAYTVVKHFFPGDIFRLIYVQIVVEQLTKAIDNVKLTYKLPAIMIRVQWSKLETISVFEV